MMTPVLFFLTLAGASFFAGIAAYKWYHDNTAAQVAAFVIFLPVFYFSVRPFMQKEG